MRLKIQYAHPVKSFVDAYYCFEQSWIARGWSLDRVGYIEFSHSKELKQTVLSECVTQRVDGPTLLRLVYLRLS